jgi:predicted TIM-barrel fold metal-dependent hydrolase
MDDLQMTSAGGIDCDVHIPVPAMARLSPYLPEVWQEIAVARGIYGFAETSLPPTAPIQARPDWRDENGLPSPSVETLTRAVLDERGMAAAICHCLYPVQKLYDPHMAAAFASATNEFLAEEVLARDARLYGSVLVSPYDIPAAVAEVRRRAENPRFVQVVMLATAELPYGNPFYDSLWEAAVKADMPVALHIGNSGRHPPTATGWASYRLEDEIDQALAFQGQLASLISHGVFARFPGLRIVLLGSGVTWLPAFAWRIAKFWHGTRIEVPWLKDSPIEVIRRQVRLTTQPFDGPSDDSGEAIATADVLAHLEAPEMLLYASAYPRWHFEGTDAFPPGFDDALRRCVSIDNPRATYGRI